ncbi:hypothetical protein GGS26DRAFT_64699 [Hypomontagnella submonticulosa]|nr:hypothetical protein GGS26DRAFT_64699 [Hypomontagnella submonticulosa]
MSLDLTLPRMDSNFEIAATVLLAVITIVIINILVLIIHLPSTRARGDLIWDSRVLGEWVKYQRFRLRNSVSLDSQEGQKTGSSSLSRTYLSSVINSLYLPIFKYVTVLELPVIFLASPDNMKGPVEGEIWYIDGSVESCTQTRTAPPEHLPHIDSFMSGKSLPRERVNTVANDKASWLRLLEVLQRMERESTHWESRQWRKAGGARPDKVEETSLAVGVQPYKRVFDGTSIFRRPFATTTICHLVELAAVLGIYWKQFDRNKDKYRAEGNGLSLRGTRIENFGLVFTFERMGWYNFEEKRVIPTSDVKELCFGNAPTFYRPRNPSEDMGWQEATTVRQQMTLKTLRLGSEQDMSTTLTLIGCNKDTISHLLSPESKKSHLFPVVFEIMGMLSRTYHLKNRCFTYLPNPTMHYWNRRELSLRRLLSAFRKYLHIMIAEFPRHVPSDIEYIQSVADDLLIKLRDGDHHLSPTQLGPTQLDALHDALSQIDNILSEPSTRKEIVLDVIRRHLQELLQAINEPADEENTDESSHVALESPSLERLISLPPEYREHEFMRVYFSGIRQRVVSVAYKRAGAGEIGSRDAAGDASLRIHMGRSENARDDDDDDNPGDSDKVPPARVSTLTEPTDFDARRNTIWCALVFRTICWLLLHDFDEQDVQLPKSEVQGSRLPVYIQ